MRLAIYCCALWLTTSLWPAASAGAVRDLTTLGRLSRSLQELAARVSPAVVQVFTTGYTPGPGGYLNSSGALRTRHSGGSGVILDPAGYIITNAHVVREAQRVQVLLAMPADSTGSSILKPRGRLVGAQVVRMDIETDLAVLKVEEKDLPFLHLGDSDELRQGQIVLAFGSPLGLENSVSIGVVSSRARQLKTEDPMIYIQTDAPINPGNSGGPLVDTAGRVVGINTFILSQSGGSEGLGFAAPSNIVRAIFEQVRDNGRVRRGVIGVRPQTITPVLAAGLGLSQSWGVVLSDVFPKGPAQRAGLQMGDVVLRLNGKVMENGRQFTVNLYQQRIGSKVQLEILRGQEELQVSVEVIERSNESLRFVDLVDPERNLVPKLGILCLEIDDRIARMLPHLRQRAALVVAARSVGAPYWQEGFEPGDVIYAINGKRVRTLLGLRAQLEALEMGDAIVVHVERGGELRYIALRL